MFFTFGFFYALSNFVEFVSKNYFTFQLEISEFHDVKLF